MEAISSHGRPRQAASGEFLQMLIEEAAVAGLCSRSISTSKLTKSQRQRLSTAAKVAATTQPRGGTTTSPTTQGPDGPGAGRWRRRRRQRRRRAIITSSSRRRPRLRRGRCLLREEGRQHRCQGHVQAARARGRRVGRRRRGAAQTRGQPSGRATAVAGNATGHGHVAGALRAPRPGQQDGGARLAQAARAGQPPRSAAVSTECPPQQTRHQPRPPLRRAQSMRRERSMRQLMRRGPPAAPPPSPGGERSTAGPPRVRRGSHRGCSLPPGQPSPQSGSRPAFAGARTVHARPDAPARVFARRAASLRGARRPVAEPGDAQRALRRENSSAARPPGSTGVLTLGRPARSSELPRSGTSARRVNSRRVNSRRPRRRRGSLQESCLWAPANPRPRRRRGSLQGSRRPDGLCGARAAPAARLAGKRRSSHPRPTRARLARFLARRERSTRQLVPPDADEGPPRVRPGRRPSCARDDDKGLTARRLPDGPAAREQFPPAAPGSAGVRGRPVPPDRPPRPKLRPPKPRRRPCGAQLPCDANGARASSSGLTAPPVLPLDLPRNGLIADECKQII